MDEMCHYSIKLGVFKLNTGFFTCNLDSPFSSEFDRRKINPRPYR